MSLQDIFKQYYGKAKKVDISGAKSRVSNSAMSSLGGFSQKLEERRRKAREAKEAKEAKVQDDKMSAKEDKMNAKEEEDQENKAA